MNYDYDTYRKQLEALVSWYRGKEGQRNEATTRLQLINRLFIECLGWSREDIECEESYNKEYSDYTFKAPSYAPRRILIVEAKKEGVYFEFPVGKTNINYSIPSISKDNPQLKEAIGQATHYCQTRGTPFGAISNGHQIVAFVATRNDGKPPLEGQALVFPSLEFMLDNFIKLWNALSKPSIEGRNLQKELVGDIKPTLPPKLSATINNYPGAKDRNPFQADLQILSDLVLEDVAKSHDLEKPFLKECYCQSGALSQYALISKNILESRYAALFDAGSPGPTIIPAVDKKGISKELLSESISKRPVLLIGDVGVGKSIFIKHLINISAESVFKDALCLYLDLGTQAVLADNIKHYIVDEIAQQLKMNYEINVEERNLVHGIYHGDIIGFEKGIYGDIKDSNPSLFKEKIVEFLGDKLHNKEQHLKKAMEHLTLGRKKQVVIFLDNADQRSGATQQEVFLIAQEFAMHWPMMVFVALRPETFHSSMKTGAISGYHPKAFTIPPPRIDLVIKKRFQFALKITSGEIPVKELNENVKIRLEILEKIIKVMGYSLDKNMQLSELIDNISGGNIRSALDLIKGFFGSGHVNTEKIVKIFDDTGEYLIPVHEFLRAVIYGDNIFYSSDRSPISNIFDLSSMDGKEHFILPLLIGVLSSRSTAEIKEGFVETVKVYELLQGIGFTPEKIDEAINKGHEHKLIETSARSIPSPDKGLPAALRPTTIGVYHITRLCRLFTYIDSIIVDTPIIDDTIRNSVHNVYDINDRLDRADLFIKYLDEQWKTLKDIKIIFDWPNVSDDLKKDIQNIRGKIESRDKPLKTTQ